MHLPGKNIAAREAGCWRRHLTVFLPVLVNPVKLILGTVRTLTETTNDSISSLEFDDCIFCCNNEILKWEFVKKGVWFF